MRRYLKHRVDPRWRCVYPFEPVSEDVDDELDDSSVEVDGSPVEDDSLDVVDSLDSLPERVVVLAGMRSSFEPVVPVATVDCVCAHVPSMQSRSLAQSERRTQSTRRQLSVSAISMKAKTTLDHARLRPLGAVAIGMLKIPPQRHIDVEFREYVIAQ